jgi:bifunctional UDP-N-acetylglucosamine pyrophosphorylase / glucosamine-1-phosphate N-acetyltransferase
MTRSRAVVILAAGQGTRMKSTLPKVLHKVGGREMLGWAISVARSIGAARIVVVCAPGADVVHNYVRKELGEAAIAIQSVPLGTAHALLAAKSALGDFDGDLAVLFADTPLIKRETIENLLASLTSGVSVLGFEPEEPGAYGRLVLDGDGSLLRIVEAKDAGEEEKRITLCNSGVMCGDAQTFLRLVGAVGNNNAKGEYYITDVVGLAVKEGRRNGFARAAAEEVAGVNGRAELAEAEAVFQARARTSAMDGGVTLRSPEDVFFNWDTELANDVIVEPGVIFGPGVRIAAGSIIRGFSHLEGVVIGENCEIGPFARLRPGTQLGSKVKIGNFVEVKKTHMGEGAKASHLSYLGDAEIGAAANIGAGTITCNYDGYDKFKTVIGPGAFIGSNTALVAPVTIGSGAYTGSGSVVTHDVEPDALALGRARQEVKLGWATRFRAGKRAAQSKTSED